MRKWIFISLALLMLATTGCSTVIKQAYYGAKGAQGKFYELKVVDPDVLTTYKSIRFEPFTNELSKHVPGEVVTGINELAPKTVAEANIFYPKGKTLVVNGKIIHFTGKSGAKGSVSSVIGSDEICVCRVQLTDADSGDLVGEGICWGIVKSAVRRGSEEFGAGVGKGLIGWFEERLPEDDLDARQEELGAEEPAEGNKKEDKSKDKDAEEAEAEEKPETKPAE